MKKILLAVVLIATCMNAVAQDKAFEKGTIAAGLGAGFGIYITRAHETGPGYSNMKRDGAVSGIFPLSVEYGVTDWLGIGGRFAYNNYMTNSDSTSGIIPTIHAIDAGISLNFHVARARHFDMPFILHLGYSHFSYLANDPWNSKAVDNGLGWGIELHPRIYFGDHIGMFFNLGYLGYKYPSLHFSNSVDPEPYPADYNYELRGGGFNLGIGLMAKF